MMFPCTQTGSGPWVPFYKVHVGLKGRRESQWLNECCHSGIALNFDELRTIVLIDRVHHLDHELGCCAEQCVFDNICICIGLLFVFVFD